MMKPCLILGGGVSGRAARRLAETLGMEAEILSDPAPCPPEEAVAHRSLLVTSPGVVPLTSPLWQAAARRAERGEVEFISELEFGFRHLPRRRCIAITGTNGKTTTTELACHLLNASGVPAVTAGNIGVPLSDIAAERGAIATYNCMISKLSDERVAAVLQRIVMDEELHLEVFKKLLARMS